jgi:hypothetical protein
MPSDIEICNIALSRVAQTQPIVSFTEKSKAAELCSVCYPAGCHKFREIVIPGQRRPLSSDQQIPFSIGYDVGGKVIHTDQEAAQGRFTFKVEDSTFFDPLFVDALAWRLGMDLALPLSSKPDLQQYCQQQYEMAKTRAQGSAFEESQDDPEPESEFVTVRS